MTERYGEATERRAAKPHICDWCGTAIARGEVYSRYFGPAIDDPEPFASANHLECVEAMKRETAEAGDPEYVSWGDTHAKGKTLAETMGSE